MYKYSTFRARSVTTILIAMSIIITFHVWGDFKSGRSNSQLELSMTWEQLFVKHEWWRMLTAPFVHWTWGHLIGNMIELWLFGNRTAMLFGIRTYMLVFFLGGSIGGLSFLWYRRDASIFGASGATCCLLGVLIVHFGMQVRHLSRASMWKLGLLISYGLATCALGVTNLRLWNFGHSVSLVTGLGMGLFLWAHRQPSQLADGPSSLPIEGSR